MRYGRIDANQVAIVKAIRELGATVQSLADLGKGVPDLLIGFRGEWRLWEIKTARGKLTASEREWIESAGAPVTVIRSVADAIDELLKHYKESDDKER